MEENKTKFKKELFRSIRTLKGNSKNRGITLIALIITILIILILAGLTINLMIRTKWINWQSRRKHINIQYKFRKRSHNNCLCSYDDGKIYE